MALPAQIPTAAQQSPLPVLHSAPGPEALVVADDAVVAEALALALSSCGVGTRVAAALPLHPLPRAGGAAVVFVCRGTSGASRTVAALVGEGRRVAVLADPADPALPSCLTAGAEAVVSTGSSLNTLVTVVSGLSHDRPVDSPVPLGPLWRAGAAAGSEAGMLDTLTPREHRVLSLLAAGVPAASIARSGYVSLHTVRTQIRSILRKLDVHSQLEAVAVAHRAGWSPSNRPV